MFTTVELPVWALILMGLLAAVTAASHLLFPSVRWFFRKRAERVVTRLNQRLARPIEPFKLARRHDMIQNVLYDPDVIIAVNEHAEREGVPENVAFETAQRYAREIVPSFSASIYFGIGIKLAKWLARTFYRVRVVNEGREGIESIDPEATVVFIMNHRSNMDYVLVTYLAARDTSLSYAVGEWARVWPLRPLIKMMGGYFIRRKRLNPLYRRVLARYVQLSTKEGVTQAVFPEGGLSRDGALGEPKLGLLSYIMAGFDAKGRDVVFVPVGINYDRVLEDRVLVAAAGDTKKRFRLRWRAVLRYVGRHIKQKLTRKFHYLGFAAVSFGEPVSLRAFLDTKPEDATSALAVRLMLEVGKAVPVLPVPLIARHLKASGYAMSLQALRSEFGEDVKDYEKQGSDVILPYDGPSKPLHDALIMLKVRGVVSEDGDQLTVPERWRPIIDYYAASIAHIDAT